MSETLHPGDIAIVVWSGLYPERVGMEVEVVSELFAYEGILGYKIMIPGMPCPFEPSTNGEWFAPRECLKKKRPPNRDIEETRLHPIEWDDCIWQPERVEA